MCAELTTTTFGISESAGDPMTMAVTAEAREHSGSRFGISASWAIMITATAGVSVLAAVVAIMHVLWRRRRRRRRRQRADRQKQEKAKPAAKKQEPVKKKQQPQQQGSVVYDDDSIYSDYTYVDGVTLSSEISKMQSQPSAKATIESKPIKGTDQPQPAAKLQVENKPIKANDQPQPAAKPQVENKPIKPDDQSQPAS